MSNSTNVPQYDEDAEQCNDGLLLVGSEQTPFTTDNDNEACAQLSSFFANAWIH